MEWFVLLSSLISALFYKYSVYNTLPLPIEKTAAVERDKRNATLGNEDKEDIIYYDVTNIKDVAKPVMFMLLSGLKNQRRPTLRLLTLCFLKGLKNSDKQP